MEEQIFYIAALHLLADGRTMKANDLHKAIGACLDRRQRRAYEADGSEELSPDAPKIAPKEFSERMRSLRWLGYVAIARQDSNTNIVPVNPSYRITEQGRVHYKKYVSQGGISFG